MIITKIHLKNWKNFSEIEVSLGNRLFIAGPNGIGKSNFLDSLKFLKDVALLGLEHAVIEKRISIKDIRHINATDPTISVSITLGNPNGNVWQYSLTIASKKGKNDPYVVEEIVERYVDGTWQEILRRPDADDKEDPARLSQTALQQINANKGFREISQFFSEIHYQHMIPQCFRDPRNFSSASIHEDPFGRDLAQRIWRTPEKARSHRMRLINQALCRTLPNFQELTVALDHVCFPHLQARFETWRNRELYQDQTHLSDGTLRLIGLLWSLISSPGVLLLEEPEIGLHEDSVVKKLPVLLTEFANDIKSHTRQMLVTTHSEHILLHKNLKPSEILKINI